MWKESWWGKDFTMSAVPKGRTRWSSRWVMWGLVPAGLNISDKSCDFILVFWWSSVLLMCAVANLLSPHTERKKKRISIPSLAMLVLASCKGHCYIPAPTPSHQSASRWTSWSLQCCFPGGSPHTKWAYLAQSLPLQNPSPFPHARCCIPTIPHTSHALCYRTHQQEIKSKQGGCKCPTCLRGRQLNSVCAAERAVRLDLSGIFWSHGQLKCRWKRCVTDDLPFWAGGENDEEPALNGIKPYLADSDSSTEYLLLEGMKIYLLGWMGKVQR